MSENVIFIAYSGEPAINALNVSVSIVNRGCHRGKSVPR
jgi:hypothetical protein